MAKPKEISEERYESLYDNYMTRAYSLSTRNDESSALYLSRALIPCSGIETCGDIKEEVRDLIHFSAIACDEFCAEKLPMVTCLCHTMLPDPNRKDAFYITRHKVGNCPWKIRK